MMIEGGGKLLNMFRTSGMANRIFFVCCGELGRCVCTYYDNYYGLSSSRHCVKQYM